MFVQIWLARLDGLTNLSNCIRTNQMLKDAIWSGHTQFALHRICANETMLHKHLRPVRLITATKQNDHWL